MQSWYYCYYYYYEVTRVMSFHASITSAHELKDFVVVVEVVVVVSEVVAAVAVAAVE